jgi:hypothetical protein
MPAPPDRYPEILEQIYPAIPLAPLNVLASTGFEKGVVDIRWTNPAEIAANTTFNILGVNVYRSFDSAFGPYFRLTQVPIGSTFYRDRSDIRMAVQENVSDSFILRGPTSDPSSRYVFRTIQRPIHLDQFPGLSDWTNLNVQVTINGKKSFVEKIDSTLGEVSLGIYPSFDVGNKEQIQPVLPTNPSDVVLATYKYVKSFVPTDLAQRIFYRLTTVAYDPECNQLIETPLDRASQTNNQEVEKLDWIWKEAVRRNRWILQMGGERVKLFIRRVVGPNCGCNSSIYKQPSSDCVVCYGTGIIGGYSGPYDIVIAPDDADKSIKQANRGRNLDHSYETWTSPSPLLSQRDFVVKLNGDRYGIGPVRMPTNRGMQLQQFFTISHLDEQDIRYKIPVLDTTVLVFPQTRYTIPGKGNATPMVTESQRIPDEHEIRGATVTFQNTQY